MLMMLIPILFIFLLAMLSIIGNRSINTKHDHKENK